jgi:hypothetical protein
MVDEERDNVVFLPCVTSMPLPPSRVLKQALTSNLETVVVIGYTQEGGEYLASSEPSGPEVLWLLERARLKLLRQVDIDNEH